MLALMEVGRGRSPVRTFMGKFYSGDVHLIVCLAYLPP